MSGIKESEQEELPYFYVVEFYPNAGNELIPGDNRHLNKNLEFIKAEKLTDIKRFPTRENAEKMAQLATNKRDDSKIQVLSNVYDK